MGEEKEGADEKLKGLVILESNIFHIGRQGYAVSVA